MCIRDSVQPAQPQPAEEPAAWCDVHADAGAAEPFSWPELDGAATPPSSGGWTWVNAWATWCKPCLEEMPRLAEWEVKLQREVGPGAIRYLSLDATAAAVERFDAANPALAAIAGDLRIADAAQMDPWVEGLGLEPSSAALPVHVFIDAGGRVRCVTMGGISEGGYATVRGVLSAL